MKVERTATEQTVYVCDACGKNEHEVRKLLLLPNYNLRSECIGLAHELIEEDDDEHITTLQWLIRLGLTPKSMRKVLRRV